MQSEILKRGVRGTEGRGGGRQTETDRGGALNIRRLQKVSGESRPDGGR